VEPPTSFEFLFTPFSGPLSFSEMQNPNSVATGGFAEFAPVFMMLAAVNYQTVHDLLGDSVQTAYDGSTSPSNVEYSEIILKFARNALLASVFMEYSPIFFSKFVFPTLSRRRLEHNDASTSSTDDEVLDAQAFWGEVGGCLENFNCPRLACGDLVLSDIADIMSKYSSSTLLTGTLDGEAMGGCANPFIAGFMKGTNTSDTDDDMLASAASLTLLAALLPIMHESPPIVGPFEDLVGSVCPHAWHAIEDTTSDWLTQLDDMNDDTENQDNDLYTRCNSHAMDIFSNRISLPTQSAYHYGAAIMYMPSEFEVYAFKQWLVYTDEYATQGMLNSWNMNGAVMLLLMKLRYRGHGAEHHAIEDINSYNSRALSAAECDGAPTSYDITQGLAGQMPSDPQEPCIYMHFLLLVTAACKASTHKNQENAMCKMAIKALLQMLREVCEGTCSKDILSDYFCTSVTALSGSSCDGLDVLNYYMSASEMSCDNWGDFVPTYCTYSEDPSIGYTTTTGSSSSSASSGSGFDSNGCPLRRSLEQYGPQYGQDRRSLEHCTRRLSHDISSVSYFRNLDALDNQIPINDWVTVTPYSETTKVYKSFMDFGDFGDPSDDFSPDEYESKATAMLTNAKNKLAKESLKSTKEHVGRLSLIQNGLETVLTVDDVGSTKFAMIRDLFGEFLHHTALAWETLGDPGNAESQDYVPIFAICDAEFEESLVRDATHLRNAMVQPDFGSPVGVAAGNPGPCALGPAEIGEEHIANDKIHHFAKTAARFFW